jgi:hypothetical protein
MSGLITSGNFSQALRPGIERWWYQSGNPEKVYTKIFEQRTSGRSYEEHIKYNGFDIPLVKPEGEPLNYDSSSQEYLTRYYMTAYATGFVVSGEMKRDDQYGLFAQNRTSDMRFSMDQGKEYVHAAIFNDTAILGGDGKALFATDHTSQAGTVASSRNTSTSAAALSETSLNTLFIQIRKAENSRGLRRGLMMKALQVPVDLQLTAEVLTKSQYRVGGGSGGAPAAAGNTSYANNEINPVLATMGLGSGAIIVNPYLTSTSGWYVHTNAPNGLISYQRDPIMIDVTDDFETKNTKVSFYERYGVLWSDWQSVYQGNT